MHPSDYFTLVSFNEQIWFYYLNCFLQMKKFRARTSKYFIFYECMINLTLTESVKQDKVIKLNQNGHHTGGQFLFIR